MACLAYWSYQCREYLLVVLPGEYLVAPRIRGVLAAASDLRAPIRQAPSPPTAALLRPFV